MECKNDSKQVHHMIFVSKARKATLNDSIHVVTSLDAKFVLTWTTYKYIKSAIELIEACVSPMLISFKI